MLGNASRAITPKRVSTTVPLSRYILDRENLPDDSSKARHSLTVCLRAGIFGRDFALTGIFGYRRQGERNDVASYKFV